MQAVLYQLQWAVDELTDELRERNKEHKSIAFFVMRLGLTQNETSELCRLFIANRQKTPEEILPILKEWMEKISMKCQTASY